MNLLLISFLLLSIYKTTEIIPVWPTPICTDYSCNKECMTGGHVCGRCEARLVPVRPSWECKCHEEKNFCATLKPVPPPAKWPVVCTKRSCDKACMTRGYLCGMCDRSYRPHRPPVLKCFCERKEPKHCVTPKPITPTRPNLGPIGCTKLTCNKKCVAKGYPCGKCIPLSWISRWNCRCQKEEKYCVTPKPITSIQPTTIATTPATTIKIPIRFHAGPCSKDPCIKKCVAEGYLCGICFTHTFLPKPKCICVNSEFNCAPLLKPHSH